MIDPNPPPQAHAIWASHVGRVAAAMPTCQLPIMQKPVPPSSRLATVLNHIRLRAERKDDARRSLNALELLRD